MFAILATAFSWHLRGAATAWRRSLDQTKQLNRVRAVFDQLGRDLANAVDLDPAVDGAPVTPALSCEGESLLFFTAPLSASTPPAEPRFVTYDVREGKLMRTQRAFRAARAVANGFDAGALSSALLLQPVTGWRIRYGYRPQDPSNHTIEWQSTWDYPYELPRFIEVTLDVSKAGVAAGMLSRVFVVPSGVLRPTK